MLYRPSFAVREDAQSLSPGSAHWGYLVFPVLSGPFSLVAGTRQLSGAPGLRETRKAIQLRGPQSLWHIAIHPNLAIGGGQTGGPRMTLRST